MMEIIGKDFFCNLSEVHLNNLEPEDMEGQKEAFQAAALSVVGLLQQEFTDPKMQYSRELDPIIGTGFTGLFDFFVKAMGLDWAKWMMEGRPMNDENRGMLYADLEARYLSIWYRWVRETVLEYCQRHGLKAPNRFTTVKPSGTLSLLTGASPGFHAHKSAYMIRRITFKKWDSLALAYYDQGYNLVPSQADTDSDGNLLDDPFDDSCSEWLVEMPIKAVWADMEGADELDLSQIPATAQMGLWSQVQTHYTGHNTSATIEVRESEIEDLAEYIYQDIQDNYSYTSVAILSRFDDFQSFPRLPFEPISKSQYENLVDQISKNAKFETFDQALAYHDQSYFDESQISGPAGCDSDKCFLS